MIDYCSESFFSLREAEMCLGVSAATLRQQILAGRLPAHKLGSIWVIDREDLEAYRENSLGKPGRKRRIAAPAAR